MEKKRILCFGDSLTWGFDPDTRTRFPEKNRWPMVLQRSFGAGFQVIEEGQNGRTIARDDPAEGEKNGINYIGPCLESHRPLDLVIIMLGSMKEALTSRKTSVNGTALSLICTAVHF